MMQKHNWRLAQLENRTILRLWSSRVRLGRPQRATLDVSLRRPRRNTSHNSAAVVACRVAEQLAEAVEVSLTKSLKLPLKTALGRGLLCPEILLKEKACLQDQL